MTDDPSAALAWLQETAGSHEQWWLRETASVILAHIEALEARAEKAEAALERLRPHWAKGYTDDSVAAQMQTAALSQIWEALGVNNQTDAMQKLAALEARAEKLRQERDDFADMIGAELCHQPGTVTAEWDAAKRRAEAAEAREAELRSALELIDNSISAGVADDGGPARVKADGDTRIEDGFIVGQFATQFELIMKCVQNVCRKALAAAPAAPEKPYGRYTCPTCDGGGEIAPSAECPDCDGTGACALLAPADAESGSAEGAASRDLLADIDAALAEAEGRE